MRTFVGLLFAMVLISAANAQRRDRVSFIDLEAGQPCPSQRVMCGRIYGPRPIATDWLDQVAGHNC